MQAALLVFVPPPTIESMEKPIFGLEGTAAIGVGARGIIVCICVLCSLLSFHVCLCNETNDTCYNVRLGQSSHLHNVPLSVGLDKVMLLLVETSHISDSFHIVIFF